MQLPNFASLRICDAHRRCAPTGVNTPKRKCDGGGDAGSDTDSDVEEITKEQFDTHPRAKKRANAFSVVPVSGDSDTPDSEERAQWPDAGEEIMAMLKPRDVPNGQLTWRDNLYIAHSNILGIGQQPGLFTAKPIPKGGFICFYGGTFYQSTEWGKLDNEERKSLEVYAVGVNETSNIDTVNIVLVPKRQADNPVNFVENPGAAANEPKEGDNANAFLQANLWDVAVGAMAFESYVAIALYACRDIEADEEILWNYGQAYEHVRKGVPYTAGFPCEAKADTADVLRRVESIADNPVLKEWALYPIEVKEPESDSDPDYGDG